MTADGFACLEFRVLKWRPDETRRPEKLTIHVLQNNQSFVTEIRVQGEQRIYEIIHATIHKGSEANRIKILFAAL